MIGLYLFDRYISGKAQIVVKNTRLIRMNKDKSFTAEEKLGIIKEAEEFGIANTMRKYDIPITTYKHWLKKYETDGLNGLDVRLRKATDLELQQLKQEQLNLKKLLAQMQVIIEKQDDIIKQMSTR